MKTKIERLIKHYENEIEECNNQLYYFTNNGNERIEGLKFAYYSIISNLRQLLD